MTFWKWRSPTKSLKKAHKKYIYIYIYLYSIHIYVHIYIYICVCVCFQNTRPLTTWRTWFSPPARIFFLFSLFKADPGCPPEASLTGVGSPWGQSRFASRHKGQKLENLQILQWFPRRGLPNGTECEKLSGGSGGMFGPGDCGRYLY